MRTFTAPYRPILNLKVPGIRVFPHCELSTRTSMKMKSTAAVYAEVNSPEALVALLDRASAEGLPAFCLGGGKNTLFATSYFDGVVFSLGREFSQLSYRGNNIIRAGAGVKLPRLLSYIRECGLMGLEFLTMVPGTVGGSLAGNAGAGGWGLCDYVESVYLMARDGFVACVNRNEFRYSYRHSELREAIVLDVDLRLERLNVAESERRIQDFKDKKVGQPYEVASCGCIFKNPKIDGKTMSAGKLIDDAGLKGYSIRSARVSEKHANFFVNTGQSCGEDFLALISLVRDIIQQRTGVELELEVQIVGGPLSTVIV